MNIILFNKKNKMIQRIRNKFTNFNLIINFNKNFVISVTLQSFNVLTNKIIFYTVNFKIIIF